MADGYAQTLLAEEAQRKQPLVGNSAAPTTSVNNDEGRRLSLGLARARVGVGDGDGVAHRPAHGECCGGVGKYLVLAGMVATWVAMSELLQGLEDDWDKPYFLCWFIRCLYLPIFGIPYSCLYFRARAAGQPMAFTLRYAISARSLLLSLFWMSVVASLCAYTWYLSLPATTVAANNSIYQSMSAFVYLLSIVWLKERATVVKSVAVAVCIAGVILISVAPTHTDNSDTRPSVLGYVWLIISVLSYAVYEVAYTAIFEKDDDSSTSRPRPPNRKLLSVMQFEEPVEYRRRSHSGSASVHSDTGTVTEPVGGIDQHSAAIRAEKAMLAMAIIGGYTVFVLWIFIVIFDYTGVEPFQAPPHDKLWLLIGNGVLDSVYNGLLVFGILITTPLFMSVGTMLVLPVSIIVDYFVHGTALAPIAIAGVVLVALGFLALNVPAQQWVRLLCCCRRKHRV